MRELLDLVPKKIFLTKGKGTHEDKLTSFEYAEEPFHRFIIKIEKL